MFCLVLVSCSESIDPSISRCDVLLETTDPVSAEAGSTVLAYGNPLTDKTDTALFLGSSRADIQSIERQNCEDCDTCKLEMGCSDCSDCPACAPTCNDDCIETILFTVPEVDAGVQELLFYNAHGSSNTLSFEVLESSNEETTEDETEPSNNDTGAPID